MSKTKPNTLIIVGNIASGKSTAMALLAKRFGARQIQADELFQTTDPFAKSYLKDIPRWAFTNELWLTVERSTMIHSAIARKTQKLTIIDSGLLMSWVYSYGHHVAKTMNPDEWELYQRLYDAVSQKVLRRTAILMLRYPIPTLMKRMKKRGRAFELQYYNRAYLNQIQKGLDALQEKLKKYHIPIIIVDEHECPDFESNTCDLDLIEKRLKEVFIK